MSRTLEFTVNYDLFKDQNKDFFGVPVYEDDNVIVKVARGLNRQSYESGRGMIYYVDLYSFEIRYKAISSDANPKELYTNVSIDGKTPIILTKGANGDANLNERLGLSETANATASVKFVCDIAPNMAGFVRVREVYFNNIKYNDSNDMYNRTNGRDTLWKSSLWKPKKRRGGSRKKKRQTKKRRTYKRRT